MTCPLCMEKEKFRIIYEDVILWIGYSEDYQRFFIVLQRHTDRPTVLELEYMKAMARKYFPGKEWCVVKKLEDHCHMCEYINSATQNI